MLVGDVDKIIDQYHCDRTALTAILHEIQGKYGYLSREVLAHLADRLEIPLTQIYGVATFFKAFSLEPRGQHIVHVCLGTACHVRGANRILEEIERRLNLKAGKTAEDLSVTLETVRCVGACALGPIVMLDGKYHGGVTARKAAELVSQFSKGKEGKAY
jgi:NADH-quinone oxidoreductase subunit E